MPDILKYVALEGKAQINVDQDGQLILFMCDSKGNPFPNIEPIFFSSIPKNAVGSKPEGPGTSEVIIPQLDPPIKFLFISLLAQFNEEHFHRYQPLWDIIDPTLTWDTALIPTPETMPTMNPTGPPKP